MSTTHLPVTTGYDAEQYSSSRSLLIFPTNSRVEYRSCTRRIMQEKNRALEANFAIATRLKSKFGRGVAGKGIFPMPVTNDVAWNTAAKAFFERWASNPASYSIDRSRDLWEDQRLAAEELGAGDGEYFAALVEIGGQFMVQPLDPFEIESPQDERRTQFEDGIRTDAYFAPLSYAVRELAAGYGTRPAAWREIEARNMIHLFKRRRAKQGRGLPPIYSGLNDGNDALDTLALMKASAKLHSLLAATKVRKPANKGQGISNQIEKILNEDGTTDRLEEKFRGGAVTVELDEGESLNLLSSTRPTQPEIEGIKFYCLLLSLGVDLPLSVVMGFAGLGGTATRGDLEDAQNVFEMQQDRIVWRHSQPIYVRRLAIAQERGELPRCQDPYWWAANWHGPAKITVDYGRSADADISLVKNMLGSHERYWEARGGNARDEARKQIAFIKWLQDECATAGVDFARIIEPTPGASPQIKVQTPSAAD